MSASLFRFGNQNPVAYIDGQAGMSQSYITASNKAVNDVRDAGVGVCRWLHITDTHHLGNWTDGESNGYRAMFDVANRVGADFIAHTGDVINSNSGTDATGWKTALNGFANVIGECNIPFFVSRGNHDDNSIGSNLGAESSLITNGYWNGRFAESSNKFVIPDGSNGWCYMDIEGKKIRVVNINASDLTDTERMTTGGQNLMKISETQMTWLDSVLDVPDGWQVITMAHTNAYNYNPNSGISNRSELYAMLTAHPAVKVYIFGHQHVRSYRVSDGIVFLGGENAGGTRTTFLSSDNKTQYASSQARSSSPTGKWVFDICTLHHDGSVSRVRWGVEPDVKSYTT